MIFSNDSIPHPMRKPSAKHHRLKSTLKAFGMMYYTHKLTITITTRTSRAKDEKVNTEQSQAYQIRTKALAFDLGKHLSV